MNFDDFKLLPLLAENVKNLGYESPTPIQAQAIPFALDGRDVIGLAQTGTGKTAAFGLPILNYLMSTPPPSGARNSVRALVLAPTRELAEQINESFAGFGKGTRLRSATVYGGVNINPQIRTLRAGVDVVVACPGRLLDHVGQGTIDLSKVEVLVLDEADRMFDMGFLPDIRRILKQLPTERQTLLFSATMPEDVRRLIGEAQRFPVTVQIDHEKPINTVTHAVYPVEPHLRTDLLMAFLKQTPIESVIVFTAAKHRAKRLAEKLEKAGYTATSLQGNLSQNQRQAALNGFKDGKYQIMVATDVAARGIDVATVSHVINYDMPDTLDSYTHRVGRTGRAERTGDALSFVTGEDHMIVRSIERALGTTLTRLRLPDFDYNAPPTSRDESTFARPPRAPQQRRMSSSGSTSKQSRSQSPSIGPARSSYGRAGGSRNSYGSR